MCTHLIRTAISHVYGTGLGLGDHMWRRAKPRSTMKRRARHVHVNIGLKVCTARDAGVHEANVNLEHAAGARLGQ